MSARGWVRVSRRHPCPICGKPDWCTVSADGLAICCMRTPGERLLRNGGWLYRPARGALAWTTGETPAASGAIRAPAAVVDQVYRALLAELELSPADRAHLLGPRRGLSPEAIARNGYRSLPRAGRSALCRLLRTRLGPTLLGVPGFYLASGRSGPYLTLAGPAGLLIPVRDVAGRIVGAQIRSAGRGRRRYRWLSSAGRPQGVGSGSPVHVARPADLWNRRLWITEGPLKADIAAEYLGAVVLGIAGTSAWRSAGTLEVVAALRPPVVSIAFDEDGRPTTARHAADLATALAEAGFRVRLAHWDPARGKGIDDLLVAGGSYQTSAFRSAWDGASVCFGWAAGW